MVYYVDCTAAASGMGTRERPFLTISDAARRAQPGDTVLVMPGIYREWVDPSCSGTPERPIIYRSVVPLGAVITGAEKVDSWKHFCGDTWVAEVPNEMFGTYNPYLVPVTGDWYYGKRVVHTGEVYLDDQSLFEADNLEEVLAGTPWIGAWKFPRGEDLTSCRWFSEVREDTTRIYANFGGRNPNAHNVEMNVRRNCFFPSRTGISYITISGFTVCRSACTWAPPTAFQDGMLGTHWSKGWIIEHCEIYQAKCCGISLGKYLQLGNENKWAQGSRKSGTQNERDVICRAVNEGWDRETVGSHTVRYCNIHDCGQTGIVGHLGCAFSEIYENHIHHINNKQELDGAEIAGIKLHAAIDTQILRNHIHHCTRGLWLDWQAQGTRVSCNLFHHNTPPSGTKLLYHLEMGEDIFIEVSHGPTLVDHNLLLSPYACRLSTQGVALVHNLIAGAFTKVGTGTNNGGLPRYTPYHVPHGTKINGFMTILHGDMRFYNNIFIQQPICDEFNGDMSRLNIDFQPYTGTYVYNEYPTPEEYDALFADGDLFNYSRYYTKLPVVGENNLFANGARPSSKEVETVVAEQPVTFSLEQRSDGWYFCLLGVDTQALHARVVDSQRMGMAFEPEQRFEAPDGTQLVLNTDYCGKVREGTYLPGPFAQIPVLPCKVW